MRYGAGTDFSAALHSLNESLVHVMDFCLVVVMIEQNWPHLYRWCLQNWHITCPHEIIWMYTEKLLNGTCAKLILCCSLGALSANQVHLCGFTLLVIRRVALSAAPFIMNFKQFAYPRVFLFFKYYTIKVIAGSFRYFTFSMMPMPRVYRESAPPALWHSSVMFMTDRHVL